MNMLVVGLQYGDEGKGRVSHVFSKEHEWCVRFNGGPNAGHTVFNNGIIHKLHHLPAGSVLGKKVALDSGMVINLPRLLEECSKNGVDPSSLWVSKNVHLIQEEHEAQDSLTASNFGSTKKGIAPVYASRALKNGIRVGDTKPDVPSHPFKVYSGLVPVQTGESVLFESAQGVMLDVDYGHYPWVTSSSVFPSSLYQIHTKIGVMKAYTSRVGEGPPYLPEVEGLSEKGQEVGTTTGRRRKCYWLIEDEIKYAISVFRPTEIVVTKLDILRDMEIKIWRSNSMVSIGNLDSYKDYLLSTFPSIFHFSESPDGDLISV